ncbi:MBL fold metallo-hydrolase [Candidatus Poriferisodalis multihospitum]|uniref:MBL fold metallo-hydrolase n=1 Tax=Candidatus Poriferisodalis multihospitum TaxID=2983191 RepID=UPI002B256A29|nr:MBL fold metallo-hydrolase [Candidatus Poriferisodalis multihospitum]
MSIIKSFAVGEGDCCYIKHDSDNFTIIDASLPDSRRQEILKEIKNERQSKQIVRVIATHPEADHVGGLHHLDDAIGIVNFYCVKNQARTDSNHPGVQRYRKLHNSKKAFYIRKGCGRRWMNKNSEERGSAGINILWPDRAHDSFKTALEEAENGGSANNICPIIRYKLTGGASAFWAGDLETNYLKGIQNAVSLPKTTLVFAPHHGRSSGRLPASWLQDLDPKIVVIGEAQSQHLDYYANYNTITQNSAGDIAFECTGSDVHVHVTSGNYRVSFLQNRRIQSLPRMRYIGSLSV